MSLPAGTMSYVVLRLITTAVALIMQWAGMYKEGDLDHEACYGWCSASQAADHCPWCKCNGAPELSRRL